MPSKKIIPLRGASAILRQASSVLMARDKMSNLVGKTYEGDRDLYKYLGYKRNLSYEDYSQRYDRGGIAARIIDAYPQATWRNPPKVKEAGVRKRATEFEREWEKLVKSMGLFHYLERLDKIAGVGRWGAMLLGAPGALETPLSSGGVMYFSVFSEKSAQIDSYVTNEHSPRYGKPEFYKIAMATGNDLNAVIAKKVHYSRVLHAADGLLESEIIGVPRLQKVWNYLDDLDKIMGGAGEAFWRVVDRGIHFDVDPEAEFETEDQDDLNDELEEYTHNLKRFVVTHGVTSKVLGSETPNPQGAANTSLMLISGTTGIPKRILTGAEQGQLASEQDERNFNARVKERQTSYAMPMLLLPLIERLITAGAVPRPKNEIEAEWPDTSILTEKERADIAARKSQAVGNLSKQGGPGSPQVIVTPEEAREHWFGLPRDIPVSEDPNADPSTQV